MDLTRVNHVKQNNSEEKRRILDHLPHLCYTKEQINVVDNVKV